MIGIGVSPGIAIGRVLIKTESDIRVSKKNISCTQNELSRLQDAKYKGKEQLNKLYTRTLHNIGENEAQIFKAHTMMIEDPEFFGKIEDKIRNELINAEWALKEVTDMYAQIFENMDDAYIKERVSDIRDVSNRIMKILLGIEVVDFSNLDEDVIIIAHDLTPSDTAQMNKKKVIGVITEVGGKTSHSAIMARTLEIPAIVGVQDITNLLANGDMVVLDGETGELVISPDEKVIHEFQIRKARYEEFKNNLSTLIGAKTITKDGYLVELVSNIGTPNDVDGVIKNDSEGVGLFRTEFLYMDKDKLPTEEEQFEAYKEVAARLAGKSIVIRTLDIGGDKDLPYLDLPKEMNPFLGYRAIRLCLDRTDIFKTQIRALLRASSYGNIKIMFPMISSIEELRKAKQILEEVKIELRNESIAFKEDIEVGMMIEVPSAAIMSDLLAKEVDFFSIGTNDLIQYTTAVDRGNRKISYLYNQFHPALLRLIKTVIDNGHKEGIWVGMCGEAAGDPKLIPLLIGMGLDELSMSSISILKARWIIKNTSAQEMKNIVDKIIMLPTAEDVEKYISETTN